MDHDVFELIKIGLTIVGSLAGSSLVVGGTLWGVMHTQNRTDQREAAKEKESRRIAHLKHQLEEFYSPMLGLASALYLHQRQFKLHQEMLKNWKQYNLEKGNPERASHVDTLIAGVAIFATPRIMVNGPKLLEEMIAVFQTKIGFAEPSTRKFYGELLKTLSMWGIFGSDDAVVALMDSGDSLEPDKSYNAFLQDLKFHSERLVREIKGDSNVPVMTFEDKIASAWLANPTPADMESLAAEHQDFIVWLGERSKTTNSLSAVPNAPVATDEKPE